jgi:hypothetical protein
MEPTEPSHSLSSAVTAAHRNIENDQIKTCFIKILVRINVSPNSTFSRAIAKRKSVAPTRSFRHTVTQQ